MRLGIIPFLLLLLCAGINARKPRRKLLFDEHAEHARQIIKNDCDTGGGGGLPFGPPLPTVPESFITDLEVSFAGTDQVTIFGQEMYDGARERGILKYLLEANTDTSQPKMVQDTIHYNVKKDEVLFIVEDSACEVEGQEGCQTRKTCEADDMDSLNYYLQQLFGFVNVTGESGFMGATGILEFGPQFNYTFVGEGDCHGMMCNKFSTCLHKPEENVTVLYTYAWTTDKWQMHNNGESVPVYVLLVATGSFGGHTVRSLQMQYDFFNFKREFKPSLYELESPPELYCVNKTNILDMPKEPEIFNLQSETITGYNYYLPVGNDTVEVRYRLVFYGQEFYDYRQQLTRLDHTPLNAKGEQAYEKRITTIHSFNQGLTYSIERETGACNITSIDNSTNWGEVIVSGDGNVHMLSPWDFYKTIEKWQYNGVHLERGIESDIWTGIKHNPKLNQTETYTMYYASPLSNEESSYAQSTRGIKSHDKIPIKMALFSPREPSKPDLEYNIFSYESQTPRTHELDVSQCYSKTKMRHYMITLPPETYNETRHLRDSILYYTTEALAQAANVSFIRINRIEILSINTSGVYIRFTLLNLPPTGDGLQNQATESDFDDAEIKLKNAVDDSTLVIKIKTRTVLGQDIYTEVRPITNSFVEVERDDGSVNGEERETGFTAGDMAGLGCGMVVLGVMIGFFTMYIYNARHK